MGPKPRQGWAHRNLVLVLPQRSPLRMRTPIGAGGSAGPRVRAECQASEPQQL